MKSNIVLIGFMCSGKSTVGRILSESTGKRFVDTDALIEGRTGSTIREIFERDGEVAFRRMERMVVSEVTLGKELVIALGGGAVLERSNVADCNREGVIYYLEVSPELAVQRANTGGDRPLLEGLELEEVEAVLSQRLPAYLAAADVVVHAGAHPPEEIADAIVRDFESRRGGETPGGDLM